MKNLMLALLMLGTLACTSRQGESESLPIYGESQIAGSDTLHHTIGSFAFFNQDSLLVTDKSMAGKVYVADFIFTTCPSICIPMAKEMLRVYDKYQNHPNFAILSHSIDPDYDTVPVLKQYAQGLGVAEGSNWHFLTGGQPDVFELGEKRYFVTTQKDENAPGGVLHSGAFILVDGQGRIRGVYNGIDPKKVDELMQDIDKLLQENQHAGRQL